MGNALGGEGGTGFCCWAGRLGAWLGGLASSFYGTRFSFQMSFLWCVLLVIYKRSILKK